MTLDPDRAMDFLWWTAERHRIWERRQLGMEQPWTEDEVLATRKFTNVYRVLDYGSQFVMRELIDSALEPRDQLARLFLYRFTNLPATWMALHQKLGRYPLADDINLDLTMAIHEIPGKVFSGAYMILPQPGKPGDKAAMAVGLAESLFKDHAFTDKFLACTTQEERFDWLCEPYGVGKFLAMQILTDWGYTPQCGEDRENDFIVAGPGAWKGQKELGLKDDPANISMLRAMVLRLTDCPLLQGRPPSLMDVQNCLCEFSKYVRGPRKAGPYQPANPGPQPPPLLPSHWRAT